MGRAEVDTAQSSVESLKARIELAKHQVEVAQSQVAALEVDLADMVVRAPFDGVAISKDAQPGEMISPVSAGGGFTRTGICTIVDMTSLEIEVDVSESYINRVKAESAGRGDSRCLSRLADSGARDHDRADGRPAEGDCSGAHRVRGARAEDSARHGREGVLLQREAGGSEARRCAAQAAAARAEGAPCGPRAAQASSSSCATAARSGGR